VLQMKGLFVFAVLFASVLCQKESAPFDSIKIKLTTAINIINNQNEDTTVIAHALAIGFDALFGGNLIVLPGKTSSILPVQQDEEIYGQIGEGLKNPILDFEKGSKGFNMTISNIDLFMNALNAYLAATSPSSKSSEPLAAKVLSARALVLDAKDFLLFSKEILLNLARYTMKCNPNLDLSAQGDVCKIFLADDESETVMDDVLTKMKFADGDDMFRLIRSPFFFPKNFPMLFAPSPRSPDSFIKTYQTGSLDSGQCSAIVESFFGLRAVFRPATITLWNMPWLSASSLIGKKVFAFEWLPAQLLKTISLCHTVNPTSMRSEIVQHVSTEIVLHRGALLYWQMFS